MLIFLKLIEKDKTRNILKGNFSNADSENSETQLWLDFVIACKHISTENKNELKYKSKEIGKLINYMMNNPNKFEVKKNN